MSKLPFKEKERLKWQCRRGMLELDCLLEHFLHEHYDQLPEQLQRAFRQLLREADPHLFHWLINAPEDAPDRYRELLQQMRT
ncbi:FAD assembly factor SdhE [Thiolapillus sp.]